MMLWPMVVLCLSTASVLVCEVFRYMVMVMVMDTSALICGCILVCAVCSVIDVCVIVCLMHWMTMR